MSAPLTQKQWQELAEQNPRVDVTFLEVAQRLVQKLRAAGVLPKPTYDLVPPLGEPDAEAVKEQSVMVNQVTR
jgi:hypothetical protein